MAEPSPDPISRLNAALEGRYRIEREIGEGGMATVHLAEDLRHERKVALKVLKPELAALVGAERFLAEIKTTANLKHPHILPLHDSGEADGFLYFVMPFMEGESLRDRMDREKQLPVEEAVAIASKVAAALQHAHEHGVIHRDVKPGNILFQDGEPVVADFGIALAAGVAGGARLTETGLSVGTPFYMSPEQATGDQNVGPATDTYSLACVLYEMLVGEPPYLGNTAQAVLGKIIQGLPVSATAARRSVPLNVDAAIRKALEKLPADRFTGAQAFARAFADPGFRHGETVAAGVAAGRSLWNSLSIAASALALLLAGVLLWALLRPAPSARVFRQVVSTEDWAGVGGLNFGQLAALAPDGSSMVLPLESDGSSPRPLGIKTSESTEIRPIPGTEGAIAPAYSPDGLWIAYAVGTELRKRPLVGGSTVTLAEDVATGLPGLAWLDDGTILYDQETGAAAGAAAGAATVTRISEDGGEPLGVAFELAEIYYIQGLPGGRGAIVIGCPATGCGGDDLGAYAVDLADGSSELLLNEVARAWYTPSGHIVYVRTDGAVFAAAFDLGSLELSNAGVPLFDGVRVGGQHADMLLGADGTVLFVEGQGFGGGSEAERHLVVVDLDGTEEVLNLAPRVIGPVTWSPDGESVAFGSGQQIYTYNVVLGTTPVQRTFVGLAQSPNFSPDGTRLAFTSLREGSTRWDLFAKNLTDDSPASSIMSLDGDQYAPRWASDSLIVFEDGLAGFRDLWTVDLSDPGNPRAEEYLTAEGDLRGGRLSPDGTLALYVSNESGRYQFYIRSFPDPGQQTVVSQGSAHATLGALWSPDGNTVYFTENAAPGRVTVLAAHIQRDPVPVVTATDTLFTVATGFGDLHPAGDRFIFNQPAGADPGEEATGPERLILVQNFFEELRQVTGD